MKFTLSFESSHFFNMAEKSRQKFKYLEKEIISIFKKAFFIIFIFKGFHWSKQNIFFGSWESDFNSFARKFHHIGLVGVLNTSAIDIQSKKRIKVFLAEFCIMIFGSISYVLCFMFFSFVIPIKMSSYYR